MAELRIVADAGVNKNKLKKAFCKFLQKAFFFILIIKLPRYNIFLIVQRQFSFLYHNYNKTNLAI